MRRVAAIKRAIKLVVVFALLGAVMSYAVAWAFVVAGDKDLDWGTVSCRQLIADELQVLDRKRPALRCVAHPGTSFAWGDLRGVDAERMPCWWFFVPESSYVASQGWPVRCFSWAEKFNEKGGDIPRGCFPLEIRGINHALAFEPCGPGLLINTAFYATILWLFWFLLSGGLGRIRRGRRRRRGLCVKCGYDLRRVGFGKRVPGVRRGIAVKRWKRPIKQGGAAQPTSFCALLAFR